MYHGEVSVPNEDLNIFLNTAKQFKVTGLSQEDGPRMRQNMNRPTFAGVKHPRPAAPSVPPDIRQRLPPGIQMVKRPAWEHSQEKRPRLQPGVPQQHHQQQQQRHYVDEDEEDDITEIQGSEGDEYYEEYPEYDESGDMSYQEENNVQTQASTAPPAPAGQSQMVGLLCPNCRTMCKGVAALKEHLQVCTGQSNKTPPVQQSSSSSAQMRDPGPEEAQECHICDKSFKSHRTLDNHMKKQHGLAAPPKTVNNMKGRGRPKKGPQSSSAGLGSSDWSGDGGYESQSLQEPASSGVATPHQVNNVHEIFL